MGFDIMALDDAGNDIAYLRASNRTFRMLSEQGYDWFGLLDANDCYGGVSGTGESMMISLDNLNRAMAALHTHDTKGRLGSVDPLRSPVIGEQLRAITGQEPEPSTAEDNFVDVFTQFKPELERFMKACIDWCVSRSKIEIEILFE
ncbi:MAG: hypothetical protein Q6373_007020 [Candidatus Sigynarchaeota archaeon]